MDIPPVVAMILRILFWFLLLPAAASAQCMLANPSFEVGGNPPGGWDHFGPVATAAEADHGLVSARVLGATQAGWAASGYWQPLDTEPGERWDATVRVRVDGAMPLTGASRAMVNIEWRDASDVLLSYETHTAADAASPPDTWLDFSVSSGPAPAGAVSTRLLLGVLRAPGEPQPAVLYDSATFYAQSAPTLDEQQWLDFPSGRAVEFADRTWRVKGPGWYGPGPNWFGHDGDNLWIDGAGAMHLTVRNEAGTWFSTEVALAEPLGYGDYIFTTRGDLDALDPHTILGMFLWQYGPCWDPTQGWWNPYNEIDIEIGRWNGPGRPNLQFVTQPWDWPGNLSQAEVSFAPGEVTSHAFRWSRHRVEYRSWRGGPGDESPSTLLHAWNYAGPHTPRPEIARVHVNLWAVSGPPATDQEVVLTDFTFVAEGTATALGPDPILRPNPGFSLEPAIPNPFNPRTRLRFRLERAGPAHLGIHDVAGRRVRALLDGARDAGMHEVGWDGTDDAGRPVASGTYFARLRSGGETRSRKLVLVR